MPINNNPGYDEGKISGVVTVHGTGVARNVVAVSYEAIAVEGSDDGTGNPLYRQQVVGAATSDAAGAYEIDLGTFIGEVIVVALDSYGDRWQANTTYSVGDLIRPTPGKETGYVYRCTVPGQSGPFEPATWWGTGTDSVGTATFEAIESWWPVAHAPISPEVVAYDGVEIDAFFPQTVFLTHAEPPTYDIVYDPFYDGYVFHITGDPSEANTATDIKEVGPYNRDLDIYGNVQLVANDAPPGDYNGCLVFDGSGDEIKTVGNSLNIGFHHPKMTVEFWLKPTTVNELHYIATNRDGSTQANRWAIEITAAGKLMFIMWNSSSQASSVRTSQTLTAGVWQHFALVMDGNLLTWFMDGVKLNSVTAAYKPSAVSDRLQLGASSPDPQWDYNGKMADFRITQDAKYNADFTKPAALSPTTRSQFYDGIINVIDNEMSWDFRFWSTYLNDATQAEYQDGCIKVKSSFIDIESNTTDQLLYFNTGDYTVEFSIYFDTLYDGTVILSSDFNGIQNGIKITHSTNSLLQIYIGGILRHTTSAISTQQWHKLAFSRKDGVTRFFLDGTQQGSDVNDGSNLLLQKIRLGAGSDSANRMDGFIDEIRITKAARYIADYTVATAAFPDSRYEIAPADTAVYVWTDATIQNHIFDQGVVNSTTPYSHTTPPNWQIIDPVPPSGSYGGRIVLSGSVNDFRERENVDEATDVGFYGGNSTAHAMSYQDITVPSNALLFDLRVWLKHTYTDADASGCFVKFLDENADEIHGSGLFHRTKTSNVTQPTSSNYASNHEPSREVADAAYPGEYGPFNSEGTHYSIGFVPAGAVTARVYIYAVRNGGSVLNAGGDNIRIRWASETENQNFWPTATSLQIINADFWQGNTTGWTLSNAQNGTMPINAELPTIFSNLNGRNARAGYALKGGSGVHFSYAEQTVSLPAVDLSHAHVQFQSFSDSSAGDMCYLAVEFQNASNTVLGETRTDGAKGVGQLQANSAVWAEIPSGTTQIHFKIIFNLINGYANNAYADWVQCDLYDLSLPQVNALVHPNDAT